MKKTKFSKNDSWDATLFYQLYMKDGNKYIRFIGQTDRVATGRGYLSWLAIFFQEECEMLLEDFLEWDVYYQKSHLFERCEDTEEVELEPPECFAQANSWLLADGEGSEFKKLLDLKVDTPCGYYYGY